MKISYLNVVSYLKRTFVYDIFFSMIYYKFSRNFVLNSFDN